MNFGQVIFGQVPDRQKARHMSPLCISTGVLKIAVDFNNILRPKRESYLVSLFWYLCPFKIIWKSLNLLGLVNFRPTFPKERQNFFVNSNREDC